jgi:hypothetical protein
VRDPGLIIESQPFQNPGRTFLHARGAMVVGVAVIAMERSDGVEGGGGVGGGVDRATELPADDIPWLP